MTQSQQPSSASAGGVVRSFCAAWDSVDIDGALSMLAPDAVYVNGPSAPIRGRDEVERYLRKMTRGLSACKFEILHIAEAGDIVFTERLDTVVVGDVTAVLPVAGVFEVRDGLISEWREYFDLALHRGLLAPNRNSEAGTPAGGA